MNLTHPTSKMSKSARGDDGVVYLDDSNDDVARKIRRAVTDSVGVVAHDLERPGISNLVDIYATLAQISREDVAGTYAAVGYGKFKADLADMVVNVIEPIRGRIQELRTDSAELDRLLGLGTDRATAVAEATCSRTRQALGLGDLS